MSERIYVETGGRREPIAFLSEKQANKTCQILRMLYSLRLEVEAGIRRETKQYFLCLPNDQKEKFATLDREVAAIAMVVQLFQVGEAFPTEMIAGADGMPLDV